MKAQALGDTASLEFMMGRRILEINTDHPIIKDLRVSFLLFFSYADFPFIVGISKFFDNAVNCLL